LLGSNVLAYYKNLKITAVKKFYSIGPRCQCYKTFYGRKFKNFKDKLECFAPFQSSLTFMGKGRSLPYGRAPEWCFSQVGSGCTLKHKIRLERFARVKLSNLVQNFVNYGSKKFYNIGSRCQLYKTFFLSLMREPNKLEWFVLFCLVLYVRLRPGACTIKLFTAVIVAIW
jgi:hypothetical protein